MYHHDRGSSPPSDTRTGEKSPKQTPLEHVGGLLEHAWSGQGLVVERGGHHVTHVLLREGHMRGRKEVAIPIGAVTKIGTLLIHLSLTKHQVKDLPPVDIDHPAR
jgi:hypothetical protein